MTVKTERQIAYAMAVILLLVGVICYALPLKTPKEPVRIMYDTIAGPVLFTHSVHGSESGYGLECTTCHHHPADESGQRACGDCHFQEQGQWKAIMSNTCTECHEKDEIEDTEMLKKSDAFHKQCIGCHKENDAGPQECNECHAK